MTEPCGCICSPRPILSQCLWFYTQPAYTASPAVCQFGGGSVLSPPFPAYAPYLWTVSSNFLYPVSASEVLDNPVWESGTITGSSGSTYFFRVTITDSIAGGVVLERVYLTHPDGAFPIESVVYENAWDFRSYFSTSGTPRIPVRITPASAAKFARWVTSESLGCDSVVTLGTGQTIALGTTYNRGTAHVESYYINTTTGVPVYPAVDQTVDLIGVYYASSLPYYPGTGSEPIYFTPSGEYGLEGVGDVTPSLEFRVLISVDVHCASGEVRITAASSSVAIQSTAVVATDNDWHNDLPIVLEVTTTGTFFSGETWERWMRVTLETLSYSNV